MVYKILTLDGGGAWALIEVKALIDLFGADMRGNAVLRQFDMVAANSGGSIVLGGLMEDVTLSTLLGYFMDQANREAIFSPTTSIAYQALEAIVHLGPKYSEAAKLPALQKLMPQTGNTPISGITNDLAGPHGDAVRLMIVGFDYDYNRATFFRSVRPDMPCLGIANAPDVTLAQAIHASTNAPINYFDAPAQFPARAVRYWDGGITGYNNPVLAAVTEALALGIAPQDVAALSLGTGTVQLPVAAPGAAASPFATPWTVSGPEADLTKLSTAILDDPPDSASFIAYAMTRAGLPADVMSRVIRMSPVIAPIVQSGVAVAPGGMNTADFIFLCGIGMDAVQPAEVAAISAYADLWVAGNAPNQLLHTDGATPALDFGDATYPLAKAAWERLTG